MNQFIYFSCTDIYFIRFNFFIQPPNSNLDKQQQVLLTHGDSITETGDRLRLCALSSSQVIAGIWNEEFRVFGVQFHPEVDKINKIYHSIYFV